MKKKVFALLTTEYPLMDRSKSQNHFRIPIDIMKQKGYECVVITGLKGQGHEESDIRVIRTHQHNHIEFIKAIKSVKPDFYHVQGYYLPIFLSPFFYKCPGVLTPIGEPNNPLSPLITKTDKIVRKLWPYVANRYSKILALSGAERDALIKIGSKPDKVIVVPHPVDVAFFQQPLNRTKMRKKYGIKSNEKLVVMNAVYLWNRKNQLMLARVVKRLSKEFNVRLFLTGNDGPNELGYGEKLKKIVGSSLTLLGVLQRDKIREILYASDAYVVPSYETQGLGPLEAAAAGCSLFLADVPAMRYWFNGIAEFHAFNDEGVLESQLRNHFIHSNKVNTKKVEKIVLQVSAEMYKQNLAKLYNSLI